MSSINLEADYITEGQQSGEVTANDFLMLLDAVVMCTVKDILNTAPLTPAEGDRYAVDSAGAGPSWTGHSNKFAIYKGGQWKMITAKEGWLAFNQTSNTFLRHDGVNWKKITAVANFVDNTGGAVSNTFAAIAAGAGYAQADMVAVKNALASLATKINIINNNQANMGMG